MILSAGRQAAVDLRAVREAWLLLEVVAPDTAARTRVLLEIAAGAVAHALDRAHDGRAPGMPWTAGRSVEWMLLWLAHRAVDGRTPAGVVDDLAVVAARARQRVETALAPAAVPVGVGHA